MCSRFDYFCRMPKAQKTVIICPLDWGLGHATRMVPVIELLLKAQARVIIAADKRPLSFLKRRFPECDFEQLPGYQPRYPKKGLLMPFMLMVSYPGMMFAAHKSRKLLSEIAQRYQADIIISDNRYELSIPGIYSVFITHQLHIQTYGWQKIFGPFIDLSIRKYLNKYHEVWIPDFKGEQNLSGILAHPTIHIKPKQTYIGLLSRFASLEKVTKKNRYDIVIILSGPEPQRTLLETKLIRQAKNLKKLTLILQGKPEESQDVQMDHIRLISHADDRLMASYILGADLVVSRPGYSTLMDLAFLQKQAAFIPTPGQTEQEYLAKELTKNKFAYCDNQRDFSLQKAYTLRDQFTGLPFMKNNSVLESFIHRILQQDQ